MRTAQWVACCVFLGTIAFARPCISFSESGAAKRSHPATTDEEELLISTGFTILPSLNLYTDHCYNISLTTK